MRALTHALFSVTCTSFTLTSVHPGVLTLAAIASQLPDCDMTSSIPGRLLRPLSRAIERRFAHRTITHSFCATGLVALVSSPLALAGLGWWLAVLWGYFFGWFADCFTKSGVPAFWPHPARLVIPGNPRLRLLTDSPEELLFLVITALLFILSLNLHSQGGLLRSFNQWTGIPAGAIELVNSEGHEYLLVAQVRGYNQLTLEAIAGDYQVVKALTASDLLLESAGKLYRAGGSQEAQLHLSWVRIRRGPPVEQRVQEVFFGEESFSLPASLSPRTFITGVLQVSEAEDLQIPPKVSEFSAVRYQPLSDAQGLVHLESARPQDLQVLQGYLVTGHLLLREVLPR